MQRDRDVVFSKKTEKESCAMMWFLFPLHATTILLGLLVMAYARGKSQCWLEATLYSPFYSLPFFLLSYYMRTEALHSGKRREALTTFFGSLRDNTAFFVSTVCSFQVTLSSSSM